MSAARSLERIADVLEARVPQPERPAPEFAPPPFDRALLAGMVRFARSRGEVEGLFREVPAEFFTVVDGVAVVACPCGVSLGCQGGLQGCSCDRVYLWDGMTLRAVRGAEVGCRCGTVKRENGEFVCVDCGEAA